MSEKQYRIYQYGNSWYIKSWSDRYISYLYWSCVLESKKEKKKDSYIGTLTKPLSVKKGKVYQFNPLKYPRNNKMESEISTDSCRVKKKNEIKKAHGSNFISIEFEYQNSGYSHDSMG